MVLLRLFLLNTLVIGLGYQGKQDTANQELASLLADGNTRQAAVAKVAMSGNAYAPLLLSWIENPPPPFGENLAAREHLYMGMAEAFGELKTKEAIPFLIKNLDVGWFYAHQFAFWRGGETAIEYQLPAVAALIKIGRDATAPLIEVYGQPLTVDERLAVIFALAKIGDPAARHFLNTAVGTADSERYWAEEGLKVLGDKTR